MFDKVLDVPRRKENDIQRQIIQVKTETDKYFDSEHNLYRYFKFSYFLDKMDDLYQFV